MPSHLPLTPPGRLPRFFQPSTPPCLADYRRSPCLDLRFARDRLRIDLWPSILTSSPPRPSSLPSWTQGLNDRQSRISYSLPFVSLPLLQLGSNGDGSISGRAECLHAFDFASFAVHHFTTAQLTSHSATTLAENFSLRRGSYCNTSV